MSPLSLLLCSIFLKNFIKNLKSKKRQAHSDFVFNNCNKYKLTFAIKIVHRKTTFIFIVPNIYYYYSVSV